MRDRERLEEEMEYMKTHKYAIIALAILLDVITRIKAIVRKILIKLSRG
jgi:hypothetical protein